MIKIELIKLPYLLWMIVVKRKTSKTYVYNALKIKHNNKNYKKYLKLKQFQFMCNSFFIL